MKKIRNMRQVYVAETTDIYGSVVEVASGRLMAISNTTLALCLEGWKHMEKNKLGLIMWKLEKLEDFFPCFKSMIKKN